MGEPGCAPQRAARSGRARTRSGTSNGGWMRDLPATDPGRRAYGRDPALWNPKSV